MSPLLTALIAGVSIPIGILLYLLAGEALLKKAGTSGGRTIRVALWLAPALVLLTLTLVYPLLSTIILSFKDARGETFVALANYVDIFTRSETLIAVRNNLLWIFVYTVFVTAIGLVVATLSDRVGYEKLVRTIVVLPTAISFVGAGVIWSFMYAYEPPGLPQTGTVNALLTGLLPSVDPIAWLADKTTVNGALIFIGLWMSVGLASVILSAAVKSVPWASIDGATDLQSFWKIGIPLAAPALAAVGVFQFMWVWNDLLVSLIFLGGAPDVAPLTVAVSSLLNSRGEGWEVLTAAAFILMIVPIIVFFALQRYFVRGLTAGAVKS